MTMTIFTMTPIGLLDLTRVCTRVQISSLAPKKSELCFSRFFLKHHYASYLSSLPLFFDDRHTFTNHLRCKSAVRALTTIHAPCTTHYHLYLMISCFCIGVNDRDFNSIQQSFSPLSLLFSYCANEVNESRFFFFHSFSLFHHISNPS